MAHERLHFEANMHAALRAWHAKGSDTQEPAIADTPFDELLRKESEGEDLDGEPGEYEYRQRIVAVRAVFRWILAEGFSPLKMMKRLFAIGRAMNIDQFTRMSMTEQGLMFSETKAAASARMGVLSGLVKKKGMKGFRLPGQKTQKASDAARQAAKGNTHRRDSVDREKKARQGSFLRRLAVPKANEVNGNGKGNGTLAD